jgi:hypothetical protein
MVVIFFVGYYLFASILFSGSFDKHYSAAQAIENFEARERTAVFSPRIQLFYRYEKRSISTSEGSLSGPISMTFPYSG